MGFFFFVQVGDTSFLAGNLICYDIFLTPERLNPLHAGARMLYGKYHFSCRLEDEAILPRYKGSTFRGVFGRALRSVVCVLKNEECDHCLLTRRCLYPQIFGAPLPVEKPQPRIASRPRPFVIEPPLNTGTRVGKGSHFDFNLLLFGSTNNDLPYFIYAFEQVGKMGIGKYIKGKRSQFTVEKVTCAERPVYSIPDRKLNSVSVCDALSLTDEAAYPSGKYRVRVEMLTPLRLKFENHLKADLPFHVLVRAMLRRVSSLYGLYGNGEPPMDYAGIVKRAQSIRTATDNLTWFDWRRYSSRQDQAMLMGGLVGSIIYEGEIREYMPLLDFCSEVHVGKQTSFGLGKIKSLILS